MFDFFEQKQSSPSPRASSPRASLDKPKRNKEKQKEWRKKNKERVKEIKKKWEQNHPEYRKKKYEHHKQWVKNKVETDPNYRQRMRDANKKYYAGWSDEKKEQSRDKRKLRYYQKKLEKLKETQPPDLHESPKPSFLSIETQNLFRELREWGSPIQPIQIHGVWFR